MKKYDRLFAFGCSFTGQCWPTYANIIAYEYDIPFYNYGCCGSGNQLIFWTLMQADSYFKFSENDLVIVEWTSISREDRIKNDEWFTPGNILRHNNKFLEEYSDHVFLGVRDFSAIKASIEFLNFKKCDYHMIKMCEFDNPHQQNLIFSPKYYELLDLYAPSLKQIKDSYYKVLWNNDIENKFEQEKIEIGENMRDGHPFLIEHLQYIQTVLNFNPSEKTKITVNESHNKIIEILKQENKKNKYIDAWAMDWNDVFFNKSEPIRRI